jgi:hypothetical protein
MATITETPLQELAAYEDPDGSAISLFVNLDPSETPTQPAQKTRMRSAIDSVGKLRPDEASHDGRVAFDTALRRIEEYLEGGGEIRKEGLSQGLAIFAHGEDVFQVVHLVEPVADRHIVGRRFALGPIAVAKARTTRAVILLASRELGHAWLFANGELRELFDEQEDVENRHKKGGWAQDILQRWTDNQAEDHLESVVEQLERAHETLGRPPIIISATEPHAALVREMLSQQAAECVVGTVSSVRDVTEGELLEQVRAKLHDHDCRREAQLLERHAAQVGRGEGDDNSPDAALAALSDSRAEWLLLSRRPAFEVYRCPRCDRLAAEKGPCPLDDVYMELDELGPEAAISKAILNGTSVWELIDIDRTDLDPGGVGVVVRFAY